VGVGLGYRSAISEGESGIGDTVIDIPWGIFITGKHHGGRFSIITAFPDGSRVAIGYTYRF
jgi:hypothetical protein